MLQKEKHLEFLRSLDARVDRLDYWQTEHLRMSGIYWALTALLLLKPSLQPGTFEFDSMSPLTRDQIMDFVIQCHCPQGGFGGNIGHDPHLTFTLSAIQILKMIDGLDDSRISWNKTVDWIAERQNVDGSFCGDEYGEVDTRFSLCAIASLELLGRLDVINTSKVVRFLHSCRNFDGGYGAIPGGESHSGQVFCCVSALSILNHPIENVDKLGEWLAWRQLPSGGLNGRPEKLEDVCYSWWVVSSLSVIHRLHWIDSNHLRDFILCCQDDIGGGISDRPEDMADVFHTLFGIAGLSLIGYEDLARIDPRYCMPIRFLK